MTDELRSKISLVQLLRAAGVELKKSGSEWQGKCPFHKDDTPSFSVNDEKGVYVCFGCGAKGDAFTWLKETEGLDFPAAKKRLAEIAGVELEPPRQKSSPVSELSEKPRNAAYYGYVDEKGKRLYEIVRREWLEGGQKKKTFLQRHWDSEGKEVWKKHPRQVLYRLDKLGPAEIVWLVEGEKDVHTLEAWGLVATTPAGGSNAKWISGYTKSLAGKKVFIIPDNDDAGKKHAQKALDAICATSNAIVLRLPGPPKSDATDWKEAGGTLEQLLELAKKAEEETEQERREKKITAKKEPNEIAREIMGSNIFLSDKNGFLFQYDSRCWRKITTRSLKQFALRYDAEQHTNQRRRGEVADFIDTCVQVPEIKWRQLNPNEIPLFNGVYNVDTFELRPHRPEDYLETVIPIAFQEQADCPTWRRALVDWFGSDPHCQQKMSALQQFFGYCLLPHARYKKALVLYGEGDTGKSQVANLLGELVGQDNRCSVSVEDMDDPRARVPIVGKMLNVLTELSSRSVVADSGFKTLISTEEPLLFDPKHLPPFMYSPACKHMIACNSLPSINDLSKATFNRMLIVRFNRILTKEEQDRDFLDKLKAELPGILNWAIAGASELVANGGRFIEIEESNQIIEEYRRAENEIITFIDERCTRDPSGFISAREVREKFRAWAGRSYTDKAIGGMMRAAGFPGTPYPGDSSRRHNGLVWRDQL